MRSRLAKVPTYCFSDVQINDLYILNIFLVESSTYTKSYYPQFYYRQSHFNANLISGFILGCIITLVNNIKYNIQ